MKLPLQILHLEDDPKDAELIGMCLRRAGLSCEILRARGEAAFRAGLQNEHLDLILSDFTMPGFDGLAALALAQQQRPQTPFVFLSGTIGEERAVLALKQGATDYVLKDRMNRLPSAVERALREAREVQRRRRAEEEARTNAERLAQLLAHSPVVLYSLRLDQGEAAPAFVSENVTRLLGFELSECLAPQWWGDHVHPEDREAAFQLLPRLRRQGSAAAEYRLKHKTGHYLWIQDDVRLVRDQPGAAPKAVGAWTDITERKRTQAELLEASRIAGKAEIATGILHDVRNVLTSVNISFSLLHSRAKELGIENLQKVNELLQAQSDLRGFLTEHEQGKKLPRYLTSLAERLTQEKRALTSELERLVSGVEHIQQLVSAQQAYAKISGKKEQVDLRQLIEEGLTLNFTSTTRSGWKIVKEFAPVPPVNVEKHKLLQILVNLVRNAKQACEEEGKPEKVITLGVGCDQEWITICVRDNGVGIPPENLPRIFEHGFTTKKDGHGFGLRTVALAAKELGGSLCADSGGRHSGASFTIKLPLASLGLPADEAPPNQRAG